MSAIMANKLDFLRDAFHTNYADDPGTSEDLSHLSLADLEYDFFANGSGLTPRTHYSIADHQYAFYCNMLGYDRTQPIGKSMADLEREYYLSLIGGSETDILVLENQFYAQTWSNWRPA